MDARKESRKAEVELSARILLELLFGLKDQALNELFPVAVGPPVII